MDQKETVRGFVVRWVGDPRMTSKWTLGMCLDPQKILEQYLTYFENESGRAADACGPDL